MLKHALFLGIFLISCTYYRPSSQAYKVFYSHLENVPFYPEAKWDSDYYLVIYVNARHLDYTNNYSFLKTIIRHPSDGSTNRDVGHAWIYVKGICKGIPIYFYGGHSGERGITQAKYFDGVMNYMDFGYANPNSDQQSCFRFEPNPAKYLWESQKDGYLEWGSGMHSPTYAAKVDLTKEQFEKIMDFVNSYDYSNYALTGNQCSSFVVQVASLAGLDLFCEVSILLEKDIFLFGERIRLWEDPRYSRLTIGSPDILEKSLMDAVSSGRAKYAKFGVR
jgi:hypothetical protein